MSWFSDLFIKKAEDHAVDYACEAVRAGVFDDAIGDAIARAIRTSPDENLTRLGFLLKITVELIDKSTPPLSFKKARDTAEEVYSQFRRDNEMVKFGTPGWDWTGHGARTLAQEYEVQYWEQAA